MPMWLGPVLTSRITVQTYDISISEIQLRRLLPDGWGIDDDDEETPEKLKMLPA